jgi:hypothetical protein
MTDYYNKYLKYKSKYINLKRDSGFLDNTIQELYLAKNKNFICKNYNSSFVNKTKYMNLKSSNRQTGGYLQKGNYQIGGVNLEYANWRNATNK